MIKMQFHLVHPYIYGHFRPKKVYSRWRNDPIFNLWYLDPETPNVGPPRLMVYNEVGKKRPLKELTKVPMELEKGKWYRIVVKQFQNKSGQFHLRIG